MCKEIGDRKMPIRLIFCGIGESIESFFAAHESAYRQFHTVKLDRLDWEPRFEIIMSAAAALGISVDETTKMRIARVSDGFPHFVHLICEKLFWTVYEAPADYMRVTATPLNKQSRRRSRPSSRTLRGPTRKPRRSTATIASRCYGLWPMTTSFSVQHARSTRLTNGSWQGSRVSRCCVRSSMPA